VSLDSRRSPLSEHGNTPGPATISIADDTYADAPGGAATYLGDRTATGLGLGNAMPNGPARMKPGERLGAYELDSHLGSGGMGDVYAAHHVTTQERVALKLLSRTSPTLLYRFKREFRALADVSHRNLISLGELVVLPNGAAFFTMELVDGLPFVEYVRRRTRAGQLPNMVRLGRAFRQLVEGVERLHEAECVHRDLKPSNLLINREGRVVVLDFGLVSELADPDEGVSRDGQVLGTPAYMAPEQAGFGPVSPSTDYYAVGVLLFECLTGSLPFRGSAMEILLQKQENDPPDPGRLVAGVPPMLSDLCMRLLARESGDRPRGDEVLAMFSAETIGLVEDAVPRRTRRTRTPFIGRVTELAQLETALHDVQANATAVTVHVRGASGHGKTALISQFLTNVRNTGDALVLRGRCLERESVPYKGVDAVVDALSAHLRRRSELDAAGFRPRHLAPLAQIFPVLSDLWNLKGSPVKRFEPAEQRRLGLTALREIFTRLADERPLVIHIDDFQWADVDGANLLSTLVRPPDPPAILLIVSFRDFASSPDVGDGERSEALTELTSAESRLGRDVRDLRLDPLSPDEARELAFRLLSPEEGSMELVNDDVVRQRADSFARGSRGNPFYIGQMVLNEGVDAVESEPGASAPGDDRIVARRIVALAPEGRRLLAAVAVAGGPTSLAVLREVYEGLIQAEITWSGEIAALDDVIDNLCELGLLTRREELGTHESSSSSGSLIPVVDAAHGRIREVTVSELETEELREIHLELANALEHLGGKPEALAEHLEHAGEYARAAEYTERAARQAVEALAFARAVQLYRRTLGLLDMLEIDDQLRTVARDSRRQRLRIALAEQLVNFGRSSEAGRLLRELANEVGPEERLVFQRQAAEQLLHAGHVVEGLELSGQVLREIGEAPPRGFWASMLSFMWGRLRLKLRGRKFELRSEAAIPATQLQHIDTLMGIHKGLVLHLELHAFVLHNRLVRLTLDAGEPRRLGTMLANEMTIVAAFGGEGQGEVHQLASQARELATRVNDLELDRVIDFQRDMVEYSLNRFRDATDQLCALLPRLDDVPGADWIRFSSVLVYSSLCMITGRWRELHRNVPQWLAAARERGNLREQVELDAYAGMTDLHRGDLEQARYHFEAARLAWDPSRYTYTTLVLDRTEIFLSLSEGDVGKALELLDKLLVAIKRSSVALNPVVARSVDQLSGRCWAIASVHAPTDDKLRARVRKVSRRLRQSKVSLYVGEAVINEAALDSLAGDLAAARQRWREAELLFEEHGIECHLAAVRWQLARVTEGEESRAFAAQAADYFEVHGVGNPEQVANMLVPVALRPALAQATTLGVDAASL
jgi:serine/threonine protein kinase/tetratricopeptide (TPR) repeat protein